LVGSAGAGSATGIGSGTFPLRISNFFSKAVRRAAADYSVIGLLHRREPDNVCCKIVSRTPQFFHVNRHILLSLKLKMKQRVTTILCKLGTHKLRRKLYPMRGEFMLLNSQTIRERNFSGNLFSVCYSQPH
jgi:hypothetical protein